MPRLATPLNLVIVAILALATIAGLVLVRADAPLAVHWQLDGRVDATLPRNLALIQMPIAAAAVWVIVVLISRFGNSGRGAGAAAGLRLILPGEARARTFRADHLDVPPPPMFGGGNAVAAQIRRRVRHLTVYEGGKD